MTRRQSSFLVATLLAVWGLVLAPSARASQAYPEAVRAELGLAEIPDPPMGCLLCHKDLVGGFTTVTKPFGRSVLKVGGTGASVPSLRAALQALDNAGTDSDFDGVGDIAELKAGTDPNVAEVVEGEPTPQADAIPLPETGCSLSGAPAVGRAWPALGVALLWLVRRRRSRAFAVAVALLAVFGVGCKNESTDTAAPAASASAQVAPSANANTGDATLDELVTIGKTCKQPSNEERVQCPDGASWKLVADFLAGRRERSAALAALATMLTHDDPGVRGLSVSILRSAFGGQWGSVPNPARVEPEAARKLLDATFGLPAKLADQVAPAAVNAAMLSGQADQVLAELAKPEHATLRPSAYPYLMTVGRLQAFAKVQQLVKEANDVEAAAAADAPLNMEAWTEAERQRICEWSEGSLSEPRPDVALKLGQIVGTRCSGHWLDSLLKRGEALARTAKLDVAAQKPLIAMCARAARGSSRNATDAQCERARELLVRVAESRQATPAAREQAMNGLAKTWPDDRSAQLLKHLQTNSDASVARGATDAAKLLAKTNAPPSALQ